MTPDVPITTTSITESKTVSPRFSDEDILITVIVVLIALFVCATFLGVTVMWVIVCRWRNRNSTIRNSDVNNMNEAAAHAQLGIVTSENAAYGAVAAVSTLTNENIYV